MGAFRSAEGSARTEQYLCRAGLCQDSEEIEGRALSLEEGNERPGPVCQRRAAGQPLTSKFRSRASRRLCAPFTCQRYPKQASLGGLACGAAKYFSSFGEGNKGRGFTRALHPRSCARRSCRCPGLPIFSSPPTAILPKSIPREQVPRDRSWLVDCRLSSPIRNRHCCDPVGRDRYHVYPRRWTEQRLRFRRVRPRIAAGWLYSCRRWIYTKRQDFSQRHCPT